MSEESEPIRTNGVGDSKPAEEAMPDSGADSAAVVEVKESPEAAVVPEPSENPKPAVDTTPRAPRPAQEERLPPRPFTWLDPHPMFVVVLVGQEEMPYAIHKDFLCAKSTYYAQYFAENDQAETLEALVKLPHVPVEVFAYTQHYLYTATVFPDINHLPDYDVLIGVWKLGHDLGINGLCDATLEAMIERRRLTLSIPSTPLLVQVWEDTPEGSSIRSLLLSWAAEYMRSSEDRAEFAKSLPQKVLSELVVAMSSLDSGTPFSPPLNNNSSLAAAALGVAEQMAASVQQQQLHQQKRNVHYLEVDESEQSTKKPRHADILPSADSSTQSTAMAAVAATKPTGVKKTGRVSLPTGKPVTKRRSNANMIGDQQFSTAQKLGFCSDLLTRMLSGPGFWTRLVGPFKEPVNPETDGVPDYFQKISRPMDLGTMKAKMDRGGYADEHEFLDDMNQIFKNCYTYWKKKDPMWAACEKLEKTFQDKYSQMNKWLMKMEGGAEDLGAGGGAGHTGS